MAKHIISETDGDWKNKSWIQELASDTKLASNLTEDYANDMLEAVADDTFPTLDAAVMDLKDRVGLTASETEEIKTAAIKLVKSDCCCQCEKLKMQKDQLKGLGFPEAANEGPIVPGNKEDVPGDRLVKESPTASDNSKVITAEDWTNVSEGPNKLKSNLINVVNKLKNEILVDSEKSVMMSSWVDEIKSAIGNINDASKIQGLSDYAKDLFQQELPAEDTLADLHEVLTASNGKLNLKFAAIPKGSLKKIMEECKCSMPEAMKKYWAEHKKAKPEDKKEDKKEASFDKIELLRLAKKDIAAFEKKMSSMKNNSEAIKYAGQVKSWIRSIQSARKVLKTYDWTPEDAAKVQGLMDNGMSYEDARKQVETDIHSKPTLEQRRVDQFKDKMNKYREEQRTKNSPVSAPTIESPLVAKYKSKITKAWFQGSTEVPKEDKLKVVSNNPETLGKTPTSGEMKYDKKPMETTAPKGEDSRPWEQDWFEGAAKNTKKDLGPSGEELTLKKKIQRASLLVKGLKKK